MLWLLFCLAPDIGLILLSIAVYLHGINGTRLFLHVTTYYHRYCIFARFYAVESFTVMLYWVIFRQARLRVYYEIDQRFKHALY